ncbi:MAG TPA: hypothetical protein VG079_01845 [Gaiellaceae bacterium]|nr:hypothetical protein [Gaiellaceae bacterium]
MRSQEDSGARPAAARTPEEVGGISPHAEVEEVWVRGARVALAGTLPDSPAGGLSGRVVLLARERDGSAEVQRDASAADGRFSAELDLETLVGAGAPEDAVWDLYLHVESVGELRVGRHLDDLAKKKDVLVYPAAAVRTGDETRWLEPYFTVKNNLSLRSSPARPSKEPADAPATPPSAASGRTLRMGERALLSAALRAEHSPSGRSAGAATSGRAPRARRSTARSRSTS